MFLEELGISSAISVELSIVPVAKPGPTRPRMKLTPVGQLVMLVYSLHTKALVEWVLGRVAMHMTMTNHMPTLTNTRIIDQLLL